MSFAGPKDATMFHPSLRYMDVLLAGTSLLSMNMYPKTIPDLSHEKLMVSGEDSIADVGQIKTGGSAMEFRMGCH